MAAEEKLGHEQRGGGGPGQRGKNRGGQHRLPANGEKCLLRMEPDSNF